MSPRGEAPTLAPPPGLTTRGIPMSHRSEAPTLAPPPSLILSLESPWWSPNTSSTPRDSFYLGSPRGEAPTLATPTGTPTVVTTGTLGEWGGRPALPIVRSVVFGRPPHPRCWAGPLHLLVLEDHPTSQCLSRWKAPGGIPNLPGLVSASSRLQIRRATTLSTSTRRVDADRLLTCPIRASIEGVMPL